MTDYHTEERRRMIRQHKRPGAVFWVVWGSLILAYLGAAWVMFH